MSKYVFINQNKESGFPRELGTPERKTVYSWKSLKESFDNLKKNTDLYTSVYSFDKVPDNGYRPAYHTARIDKIYLDLDPEEGGQKCWEETQKLHRYLKEKDLKHNIVFSGGGFHVYIYCTYPDLLDKKVAIHNAQQHFIDRVGLETVDDKVRGKVDQITRIPNSYNFKPNRQRYCIPLNDEHMNMSYEGICDAAEEQNFDYKTWGSKKLDIEPFDGQRRAGRGMENDFDVEIDFDQDVSLDDIDVPRCIHRLLERGKEGEHVGFDERYVIILYFRERGVDRRKLRDFLKDHLKGSKPSRDETDFQHMMSENSSPNGMIDDVYDNRTDKFFHSHEKLIREGICKPEWGECQHMVYWRGKDPEGAKIENWRPRWDDI